MKKKLGKLVPGMILIQDVRDQSGRVLLRSGETLSERAIKTLKSWGVAAVDVQGDDDSVDQVSESEIERAMTDEQLRQQIESMLEKMFQGQDRARAAVQELYQVVYEFNLRRAAEKQIRGDHG